MTDQKSTFQKTKAAHTTLDPELINSYRYYAITINPSNQVDDLKNSRYDSRPTAMYETWKMELAKYRPDSFDYHLRFETKNGRIHFHGVIRIKKPLTFDIYVLPRWKAICTYCIKEIDDIEVWTKYCMKQQALWADQLLYRHVMFRLIRDFPKSVDIVKKGLVAPEGEVMEG